MADDILAAIDAATGCQFCGGPLAGSVSDDFCSAGHQAAWHAQYTDALVGYREPWDRPHDFPGVGTDEHDTRASRLTLLDLAALYRNVPQRYALGVPASQPPAAAGRGLTPRFTIVDETHSLSPAALERLAWRLPRESGDLFADLRAARGALTTARTDAQRAAVKVRMESLQARLEVQMAPLKGFVDRFVTDLAGSVQAAAAALGAAFGDFARRWNAQVAAQRGSSGGAIPPSTPPDALARARALESRRNRNTGPPVRQRPPRRVDPRGGLYR